jgi:predicted metal-dependent enzyme (double-stranded beta helix superfamily)
MFDIERFIEECKAAVAEDDSHKAAREVVERALAAPGEIVRALGEPRQAGLETLYRSDSLTILNFAWAPLMTLMPHNHNMWALIGIYSGREDNLFWRRRGPVVEAAGAKAIGTGDVAALGRDVIHSVTNPIEKMTCALHVYGGDFFAPGRSEWDPETLTERPFDVERARRLFAAANARFAATSAR